MIVLVWAPPSSVIKREPENAMHHWLIFQPPTESYDASLLQHVFNFM